MFARLADFFVLIIQSPEISLRADSSFRRARQSTRIKFCLDLLFLSINSDGESHTFFITKIRIFFSNESFLKISQFSKDFLESSSNPCCFSWNPLSGVMTFYKTFPQFGHF